MVKAFCLVSLQTMTTSSSSPQSYLQFSFQDAGLSWSSFNFKSLYKGFSSPEDKVQTSWCGLQASVIRHNVYGEPRGSLPHYSLPLDCFLLCKAALPPFPLAPYARCSLCLNVLLWALTWLTSPPGLHLCITSSRTLPGPSRPHLHDRMDCHLVSLVARTDIFQTTCILCWSCLPTCLPDLNSKVNLIIRKTCMYFV